MAETTPTLGLVKPTISEGIDIQVINDNMDKIDDFVTNDPDDLADINTRLANIEGPYLETNPTHNWNSLGSGGFAKMWYKQTGKTIEGRFTIRIGSGNTIPATTPLRINLPVTASTRYGAVEGSALGSAQLLSLGSTQQGTGNTFLSGDRTKMGIYMAWTQNYSSGSWALDFGGSGPTYSWASVTAGTISGTFKYEID